MKKYSEDREENQWDDDFIFDAAPVNSKKKSTAGPPNITSHLSVTSAITSKDKRKSTNTTAWSNAFKKMGPDPRQSRTSSSRTVKESTSSSHNITKTTSTTTTSSSRGATAHNIAPASGNEEFAFFDSEDTVGFGRNATANASAAMKLKLQSGENLNGSQSVGSFQQSSASVPGSFDDGLDGNLGFDDDDFIPNVGFDDEEENDDDSFKTSTLPTPTSSKHGDLQSPHNTLSLSSRSGHSGFSEVHSSNSSASATPLAAYRHLTAPSSSGAGGSAGTTGGASNAGSSFSLMPPSTLRRHGSGTGSVASAVAMLNAKTAASAQDPKRPSPTRPGIQASLASNSNNHTPRTPAPQPDYLERQLDDLIESDQPLSFDMVESLHSSSQQNQHNQQMGSVYGGNSIASYSWDRSRNPRHSPGLHSLNSSIVHEIVAPRATRPPSIASSSFRDRPSPPTGSRQNSYTRSSSNHSNRSSGLHPSTGSRLSTNSGSSYGFTAPLSISDEDSQEDWNSQFGEPSDPPGLAKLTLPKSTNSNHFGSSESFHPEGSEPGSPFGGDLRSTSERYSERGSNKEHNSNQHGQQQHSQNTQESATARSEIGDFVSEENWDEEQVLDEHEDFIIRHTPLESVNGDELEGLQGEFEDSDCRDSDFDSEHDSDFETGSSSEEEEEEEGDWDLDLELPRPGEAHLASAQTYKEILTGKTPGGNNEDESTSVTDHESLLDFLKGTVQRTIFPPSLSHLSSPHDMDRDLSESHDQNQANNSMDSGDVDGEAEADTHLNRANIPKTNSTPSLSSRSHNNEAYEEEGHNVETANPHLRGLLDWVDASTTSLHAVLTNTNSNRDYNARTLLQSEVTLPKEEPLYIDRLLERCEVLPSSDSCIRTLEIVSKWLRAVCNYHDNIIGALHSANDTVNESASDYDARLSSNSSAGLKMRRTASLGETRVTRGGSSAAGSVKVPVVSVHAPHNDPVFGELTGSRLDKIYDWCDDILQEQLVSTTAALGAGYRKLLEINTRYIASQARSEAVLAKKATPERQNSKNHWLNMGMVAVREPAAFNTPPLPLASTSRLSTTPSDDDQLIGETFRLSSNLISLYRLQINMLEIRIHMYDSFELVACMELLQKISEELDKVTSTLFAALRRVLPATEVSTPEQLLQRQQLESLTITANDLLGCCFSIKVLAICAVSPINFQPLPEGCQRIVSSANDLARMSSFDGSSGSGSSTSREFGGARLTGSGRTTYNVIYELTLGTHFLDLMLLIPSPSVVRSKLHIAAYTYLQKLKKKELPWQRRDFKLVSIRQHLESFANMFNIYHGADAFGLNYSEMDNNTFTLSLAEVEGSIVQSFSEVFGTLDQFRIVQLLLFEGANELLPTVTRDFTGAASFLHKANARAPLAPVPPVLGAGAVADNCDSDISDPSSAAKGCWGPFTTMKGVFKHVPAALNFDKSLQLVRKRWTPGLPPISGSSNNDSSSTKNASTISTYLPTPDPVAEVTDAATEQLPKTKNKALSYSTRYELFHFCNQVLFRLAQSIVEMSPNVALDVYQMCILLLAHLRHNADRARVEKVAAMLAVKVGRRDAAIWHGEAVLKNLQRKGDNINEMLYMTDMLAAQYSENAQYELAAKALFSAISVLNRRHKFAHLKQQTPEKSRSRRKGSIESISLLNTPNNSEVDANSAMDFERALDPLLLKLGRLLLQFGCPDRAADTFQVLLSSLCERTDCLANDAKKVTVLSWLAEAYLELEDFASCAQVLGAIKSVRNVKLRKATAWAASGGGLDFADVSDKSKSPSPSPKARSVPAPPSSTTSNGNNKVFFKKNSSLLSRSFSRDIPADWRARRSGSIESMSEAALMSRSFDKSMELDRFTRPPSRGIANAGSADSFELDGASQKVAGDARPFPITPSAVTSPPPSAPESSNMRARPLPPTPKPPTPKGGHKAFSQDPHASIGRRPLPQTPVEKSASRDSTGSSTGGIVPMPVSAMSSGNPTGRKKPNLRIDVNPRPMSNSSLGEDFRQETNLNSSGSPKKDRTPKVSAGGVPVPLSTRTNSARITPGGGTKRRKNRQIQNLQPLQLSNSASNLQELGCASASPEANVTPINVQTPSSPRAGSPRAGLTPVGGSPVLSPGGNLAVNSMYLHYLRNSAEANLPQFCVTTEDLDLGQLKARLHFKNKHYILALKCLLPTLMGVELTVIGADRATTPNSGNVKHNWSRQSLMELGELYYLRGKIQLEAAKSSADVTYPFQVGSKHLFQKVQDVLWVEERHGQLSSSVRLTRSTKNRPTPDLRQQQASAQPRRFARASMRRNIKSSKSSKPVAMPGRVERNVTAPTLSFTCRDPTKYACPADLCWDAMTWFNRAREVAKLANDEVGGALAANALAMCHLLPTFVPTALFGVPLEKSKDLSPLPAPAKEPAAVPVKRDSLSRANRLSLSRLYRPSRAASMAEVHMAMEAALEVIQHSCLPLPLIDSYLNLAEMCELLGNKADAVRFWNETKELFLHLFADGALVPLVRRASLRFVRKISAVLNRIVRFMWTLDHATANGNLFLLDLQIVLSHEIERAYRKCTVKSSAVSEWLPDVLDRLLPTSANNSGVTVSTNTDEEKVRKRNSKSRFSRFFSRIFTGSFKSKTSSKEKDSVRTDEARSGSDERSGRNLETTEVSERTRDGTKKPQVGSSRSLRGAKSNTTFDSFIQRFGFDANLDVRRFYNLMNADLVMEKVHDFGWSKCVEHDQLLKPLSTASPDTRPFSVSSVHSGTSSLTAQAHYSAAGLELVGPSITTNIDVLVILNLRAKIDYQEKYKSLATARFIKDHVLRRGDLILPEEGEEEGLDGELELNGSADAINASRDEESVEGGHMLHNGHNHSNTQLLMKSSLSPRSGASSKMGSFSGKQLGSMSPGPHSQGSNTSRVMDPRLDIPIDPFADFDWMDESFADYSPHSHSLQARTLLERQMSATHSRSRNKYKRFILGDDAAQFPALFMPEFDEAHLFSTDEVKSSSHKHDHLHLSTSATTGSIATNNLTAPASTTVEVDSVLSGPTAVNREYLRALDERAETVLIQRSWRCYLLLQNAQWGYRSGKRSLGVLRSDVRSALSCLSLNMVRLRAFSRQYQSSLLDFDRLVPELTSLPAVVGHLGVPKPIEESTRKLEMEVMRTRNAPGASESVRALKSVMKESRLREPVLLQHRLPFFVYAIHFDDNLLLYRPHDGSRNMQKLGGAGFIAYVNRENVVDDHRAAQAALMNTSFSSAVSFASESSVKGPAASSHPPLHNHATPPMGIAQVEKKAPQGRTLEQKLSIMSLLSMMSGSESNSNIGGTDDGHVPHTQPPGRAPLDTSHSRSGFLSGMLHADSNDLYAVSSSEATSSHDSSWGQMPNMASEKVKVLPRKSLARAELEGSSLGSASTMEAAVAVGKPVFSVRESTLLYDLAVSTMDAGCSGGKDVRKAIFADLKATTGVLNSSVQFLQAIAEAIKQLHVPQPPSAPFPSPQKHAMQHGVDLPHTHAGTNLSSPQNSSGVGLETSSGKSGFISEASESVNTLSIHSHSHQSHSSEVSHGLLRRHSDHRADFFAERDHSHTNRFAPHREESASTASSFVALSASMSNMLGLFASSDSGEPRRRNKDDLDDDEEDSTRPPHKLLPLTVVCSHSAAALPWEALLLQAQNSAPVVRNLTLLSLCAQAYSSTLCNILPDPFAKAANQPATELALARGLLGPQWQQKAAYVAVAYESRDLPHSIVQELRAGQEERRRRTARHSLTALLQPHMHTHSATERAASRRDYFPLLQSGMQSPSSRSKQSHYRNVLSSFENGTLPTASPLFSTDRTSLSFFGKSDMIVAGIDSLSGHAANHDVQPTAKTFWRLLPPLAPLRRTISHSALSPGCRVEAVPNSSFPLLILSYVDYLQVSDALSYLVSHRPDAVLVFAPLFIIEPLAIEIKLSLDRWCKPESLPSPAPSPEKTVTLTSASSGHLGFGGGARSSNSSRFMFSSFLGFSSTGEASASTFNFNEAHNASAGSTGHDAPLPPSVTSMSSGQSANGSSATTLPGLSGKHRPLPKILEDSREFSRSESSSAQDSQQHRQPHLSPTRSHSNEALDALFDFASDGAHTVTNSPTNPSSNPSHTNPSSYRNSKSTGNILERMRGQHTSSHISSSTSSGASSSRRSMKSLRAKERTWVYHAVMSVVQDMQAEHQVPIVVFL